jgi:hypothetical protein
MYVSYTLKELQVMYSVFKEPIPLDVVLNTTFNSPAILRSWYFGYSLEPNVKEYYLISYKPVLVKLPDSELSMLMTDGVTGRRVSSTGLNNTKVNNLFTTSQFRHKHPLIAELLKSNEELEVLLDEYY